MTRGRCDSELESSPCVFLPSPLLHSLRQRTQPTSAAPAEEVLTAVHRITWMKKAPVLQRPARSIKVGELVWGFGGQRGLRPLCRCHSDRGGDDRLHLKRVNLCRGDRCRLSRPAHGQIWGQLSVPCHFVWTLMIQKGFCPEMTC